jgi:crotonobetainyl-CoA:carnitine CoA-transferase CaiB-like acyl-CoA transferase
MFPVVHHPVAGPQRITGTPIKLSETPGSPGSLAPRLGEHTAAVLSEFLQLDDQGIQSLLQAGVIVQPQS